MDEARAVEQPVDPPGPSRQRRHRRRIGDVQHRGLDPFEAGQQVAIEVRGDHPGAFRSAGDRARPPDPLPRCRHPGSSFPPVA